MRRGDRHARGAAALAAAMACGAALVLASPGASAAQRARGKDKTDQAIADIAEPRGFGRLKVEGIGLVMRLAGTGSIPRASYYRQKLLAEIQRNPNLPAEEILDDDSTALVLVRGELGAGMDRTDELNVEVTLPGGSEATSLEGGWLVGTKLHEVGIGDGSPMEGPARMKAHGPVMIDPGDPKKGTILGGGRILTELPYIILIDEEHRSGKTAKGIEDLINYRFRARKGRNSDGVAEAKTDYQLVLNVPRRYHQNQRRFHDVVGQIRLRTNEALLQQRLEGWGQELLDPESAGFAAIKLESIGANAAPKLTEALESGHPQVRFFAAEALAYLDDPAGTDALARSAVEHPQFRTAALAALAAMEHPAGIMRLRELIDQPDPELRYGAFNALRTAHPFDPFLGRHPVLGILEERGAPRDPMALRVGNDVPDASDLKRPEEPFELFVVRVDSAPMIHVSKDRRREIVIFGPGQQLRPPVVLGGIGPVLLNAGLNDRQIEVSRIESRAAGMAEQVLRSSTDLVEVIRTAAALGATYPQIVAILEGAERQANLTASLRVDALSSDLEDYDRAQIAGRDVIEDDAVRRAGFEAEDEPSGRRRFRLLGGLRDRLGRPKGGEDDPSGADDDADGPDSEADAPRRGGPIRRLRGRFGDN